MVSIDVSKMGMTELIFVILEWKSTVENADSGKMADVRCSDI